MQVQCRIIDSTTGEPIPGASITVLRNDGTPTGAGIVANGQGMFYLDVPQDGQLSISAASYTPIQISTTRAANSSTIDLEPNVQDATSTPVVVTSTKHKINSGLLIAGAAGLLLLVSTKDKKKKGKGIMGAVSPAATRQGMPEWIWPVVTVGGAALLVVYVLNKKDPKENDSNKLLPLADDQLNKLKAQGVQPTISAANAEVLSAQIVQATDDCGTDENSIYAAFEQLSNIADLWLLISTFGVRQIKSCFGGNWFTNTPYNLPQILTAELSSGEMNTVNQILASNSINYKF